MLKHIFTYFEKPNLNKLNINNFKSGFLYSFNSKACAPLYWGYSAHPREVQGTDQEVLPQLGHGLGAPPVGDDGHAGLGVPGQAGEVRG